jgi:hypothetical protein
METEQPIVFAANGPEAPAVPRRPQRRGVEPGVQGACRRVLAALDGLDSAAQLRVLRAAALLLGPDEPRHDPRLACAHCAACVRPWPATSSRISAPTATGRGCRCRTSRSAPSAGGRMGWR